MNNFLITTFFLFAGNTVTATGASSPSHTHLHSHTTTHTTTHTTALMKDFHVAFPYDIKLKALHDQVIRWIREVSSSNNNMKSDYPISVSVTSALTTTTGASLVKRALLEDIGRLCIFFGQEATTDLLLTQILTFLNDQVSFVYSFVLCVMCFVYSCVLLYIMYLVYYISFIA